MFNNVVVGKPVVDPKIIFSTSDEDWKDELKNTLFTDTRFLPAIMKEAGVVSSISEVRRNRPELVVSMDKLDFVCIKWGKKFLHILVGE